MPVPNHEIMATASVRRSRGQVVAVRRRVCAMLALAGTGFWSVAVLTQRARVDSPRRTVLTPAALTDVAPQIYNVTFDTTAGTFVIQVHRDWAPKGADRFYNLVKNQYYDRCGFFRVLTFMIEFGISGEPAVAAAWRDATFADDPVKQSNKRGYVTFATSGKDMRTTQVFINVDDNPTFDSQGFAPFGQVISGMEAVRNINPAYVERPVPRRIEVEGNGYLAKEFPRLSYVRTARLEKSLR
jgi:peptidyl-prolyl cis-trans isomerase A (cyclophilin A)